MCGVLMPAGIETTSTVPLILVLRRGDGRVFVESADQKDYRSFLATS